MEILNLSVRPVVAVYVVTLCIFPLLFMHPPDKSAVLPFAVGVEIVGLTKAEIDRVIVHFGTSVVEAAS